MNPSSSRRPQHGRQPTSRPLYERLDGILVRTPAFPVEAYQGLADPASGYGERLSRDPRVRLALATSSRSLLDALDRAPTSAKERAHRESKLLRYLIRMTTRPTPFGLCAGVALGAWGTSTDLSLSPAPPSLQSRPDMSWLLGLVWALEEIPEVRRCLRFMTNTSAYTRGGRVYLQEKTAHDPSQGASFVSLRATSVVQCALQLARQPIAYPDLVESLLAATPGATQAQVEGLITELWRQTALWTDLRPPLTGANPASYVRGRLAEIAAAKPVYEYLSKVLQAIAEWDAGSHNQDVPAYRRLILFLQEQDELLSSLVRPMTPEPSPPADPSRADALLMKENRRPPLPDALLQIDMALPLAGHRLSEEIGKEVARAVELLLRMSALPHGSRLLERYREAFAERYGWEREVPLLEALDPNFGLGLPPWSADPQIASVKPDGVHPQRDEALLNLALQAWKEQMPVVELDEALITRLETTDLPPETAPLSWDVYALLAASSASAIDAGQFQVVLGPALAALPARSSFGRFAHLLGDQARTLLLKTASEQAERAPDRLWADLVYLPMYDRSANVAICPASHPYQICYGASTEQEAARTIPLDELLLSARRGRFCLRWSRSHAEVVICSGHMLNPQLAPGVLRFLHDLSFDGVPVVTGFSWGPAQEFPFLPRVQMGRIIFSLAQWNLTSPLLREALPTDTSDAFERSLRSWRELWKVPRYVYLGQGDQRLLLDLECPAQAEFLRTELRSATPGRQVVMQEGLPGPDQAWIEGPGGHYLPELVVSLIQSKPNAAPEASVTGPTAAHTPPAVHAEGVNTPFQRLRTPGSDWLFLKLYSGPDLHEPLLIDTVRRFVADVLAAHLIDDWFFIRYKDPDPHLRLRFRGDPATLTHQLLPRVCAWGDQLVNDRRCLRVVLDTYDREIERYGGQEGLELAEALFGADSRSVIEMLVFLHLHRGVFDRSLLAVLSVDTLLGALGLSPAERLAWYRQRVKERYQTGQAYRKLSGQLRAMLGNPKQVLAQLAGGPALQSVLATRHAELTPIAEKLAELEKQQRLSQPLASLYASYVHMHCIRLLGLDHAAEEEVLGLVLRTQAGLERSPVL